jgi:hypothetical protein
MNRVNWWTGFYQKNIIYYDYLKYIKKNTKKSLCDKEEYFVADHYWGSANSHTHSKKNIKLNWKEANSEETMSEKMYKDSRAYI